MRHETVEGLGASCGAECNRSFCYNSLTGFCVREGWIQGLRLVLHGPSWNFLDENLFAELREQSREINRKRSRERFGTDGSQANQSHQ